MDVKKLFGYFVVLWIAWLFYAFITYKEMLILIPIYVLIAGLVIFPVYFGLIKLLYKVNKTKKVGVWILLPLLLLFILGVYFEVITHL